MHSGMGDAADSQEAARSGRARHGPDFRFADERDELWNLRFARFAGVLRGRPLAFVETGDFIELDVEGRRIHLDVSEEILEKRRKTWKKPEPKLERGYDKLFAKEITQAHEGCDFRFLHGKTEDVEPDIF